MEYIFEFFTIIFIFFLQLTIPHDMATLFWCKIFKAPDLQRKHHIVGYQPLIDSRPIRNGRPIVQQNTASPVHHMVLYECAEDPDKQWNEWAEGDGSFGPKKPSEWSACVTPIAAWAVGSKGNFDNSIVSCSTNYRDLKIFTRYNVSVINCSLFSSN